MPGQQQKPADKLVIRKIIPAPREKVFAAWLDPKGMRHWMCPGEMYAEAELDARVGGSFRIVMKGKEKDYEHTGEYRVIDAPSKLVFTWISEGTDHQPTLVTVEFFARGNECELVLTHERFPRPERVPGHIEGWTEIAGRLAQYLRSGEHQ